MHATPIITIYRPCTVVRGIPVTESYSGTVHPFEWTKHVVHPSNFKYMYSQFTNKCWLTVKYGLQYFDNHIKLEELCFTTVMQWQVLCRGILYYR